jgi:hypothetical protein
MASSRTTALLCALIIGGCESAESKCQKAQDSARTAWQLYEKRLVDDAAKAHATKSDAQSKLSGAIEKRIGAIAKRAADARFNPSEPGWLRGYQAQFDMTCDKDDECKGLRRANHEAEDKERSVASRMGTPPRALAAMQKAVAEAASELKALEPDFEYPEFKSAVTASQSAFKACSEAQWPPKAHD